jgi:endonuclease/exonuclease/phosphatase family metal-dependent hydrolase
VGRLRLASWNVQHGRRPDGAVDPGLLGDVVAALDADVVGLQEVDVGMDRSGGVDLAAVVAERAGMAVAFGESLRRGEGRYGNAVLVRGEVDDVEVVPLPGRPDGRPSEPRTVLVTTARTTAAGPVAVGVCHLGLAGGQAPVQLAAALDALGDRPRPRVLMGDWNLPTRRVRPVVVAAGWTLVGPLDGRLAGLRPTFPARPLSWRRIDHLAVDGRNAVSVTVPQVPVSDHRPLVVDVEAVVG